MNYAEPAIYRKKTSSVSCHILSLFSLWHRVLKKNDDK